MNKGKRALIGALTVVTVLTLTACSSSSESATPSTTPTAAETMPVETMPGTIVEVASSTEGFGTLVAAVTAAGLGETLSGTGPFTVFAPTDAAFAALPAGVLDALLLPENKDVLVKILTYHVVSGKVMAADIMDGDVATVQGDSVTLSTASGVTVNGAKVTMADVPASNGVIHVIDTVLLPPGVDVAALLG
jgi:uncharacterized surface protein with fasciclin (FAS1) repeats